MISYETFSRAIESGAISKLNFFYESKEYLIAREYDEETEILVFIFAREDGEAVEFDTAKELLKSIKIAGSSLAEIWHDVVPVCNDNLLDENYIKVLYGGSLGKVMNSAAGTAATHERYLTTYLLPSLIVGALAIAVLLLCTLFITTLGWTFFGIAVAVVVVAFAVAQVIFVSNTKRYRSGNPRAHFYLMADGVVILTDRFEYAIPYEKIIRLDTEAGLTIVTLKTVFSFTPSYGKELAEALNSIFDELKAIRKSSVKNIFKAKKS